MNIFQYQNSLNRSQNKNRKFQVQFEFTSTPLNFAYSGSQQDDFVSLLPYDFHTSQKGNRVFLVPLSVIILNSLQSPDFCNISLLEKLASQTCLNVAVGFYHYRKLTDAQFSFLPKLHLHFKRTGLPNQFQPPINHLREASENPLTFYKRLLEVLLFHTRRNPRRMLSIFVKYISCLSFAIL